MRVGLPLKGQPMLKKLTEPQLEQHLIIFLNLIYSLF